MNPLVAVLAAGSARRFGGDKLSQPCAGKPLGRWSLEAALATGRQVAWVAGEAAPGFIGEDSLVLHNRCAGRGLSASLACAANWAQRQGHDALLVLLADMPLIDTALLVRLLDQRPPAAVRYPGGRPGVPALFARSAFADLRRLSGDHGAGPLLAGYGDLSVIECSPDALLDVDLPGDLARVAALLEERAARP